MLKILWLKSNGQWNKKLLAVKVRKSNQIICAHMPCFYRSRHILHQYYGGLQLVAYIASKHCSDTQFFSFIIILKIILT